MENEQIIKTLKSLDQLKRAEAPEGFSKELFQKIRFISQDYDKWNSRLKYGVAAMIAMIIINGFILIRSNGLESNSEVHLSYLSEEWYEEPAIIEYEYENE